MTDVKCAEITRDNREYTCVGRTFMAVRSSKNGILGDWSIIEYDTEHRHGSVFLQHYKTKDLPGAIKALCDVK